MKSRYDDIRTARELVKEVALNGISTREEDICRAQDIFGHSTIEELQELARDFSGVYGKSVSSEFYFIISKIWSWEDVVKFWNETSNPEHEKFVDLRKKFETLYKKNNALCEEIESLRAELKEAKRDLMKMRDTQVDGSAALEDKDHEILRLKAKLFDMMEVA